MRGGPAAGARRKPEPDWGGLDRELRRPGVTLMLLWQEYRADAPEGYGYSRFCELYEEWASRLSPVMRQVHPAGEGLFVDYAGQTVELVDGRTGEIPASASCGSPANAVSTALEAACRRGLEIGARSYGSLNSILLNGGARLPGARAAARPSQHPRGSRYCH